MLISKDAEYLQLTLSSKLFEYAYKKIFSSVELGANGYQYNKHALVKLPIKKLTIEEKDAMKRFDVDTFIYQIYNISDNEIVEIEKNY